MTYTKLPNYVIDHVMSDVSPNAWKVLCFILRKTNGWQKEQDHISLSQIREGTGIRQNATIAIAIRELERKHYLSVVRSSDWVKSNAYSLGSPKMGLPKEGGSSNIEQGGSAKIEQGVVLKSNTQKKSLKKEEKKDVTARKKREPHTPAFEVFVKITGYYKITKYWRTKMAEVVGEEANDLHLWAAVIKAWTGKGWFEGNVKGMLEFYEQGEIPGKDKKNEKQNTNDKGRKGVLAS